MTDTSKRAESLVKAPMSVAPRTDLTTAREIRRAIERNLQGGNYGVYCDALGDRWRVYGVKTEKGQVKVRVSSGWLVAGRVYVEG